MNALSPADPAPELLRPGWGAPQCVRGFVTLRGGGVGSGAWGLPGGAAGGWNLATHCGDDPGVVARNREFLRKLLPADPVWLEQVHGRTVHVAQGSPPERPPVADAAVTARRGVVLAVLTADCLPVLFTNPSGDVVGIAHAGWRGLVGGVLEATVEAMTRLSEDHRWIAWLGPAIGPACFEVGDEVREAFVASAPEAAGGFAAAGSPGKWLGNLDALARLRLAALGATVWGGGECTVTDPRRYWSYRRDRVTGRMASVIWIA